MKRVLSIIILVGMSFSFSFAQNNQSIFSPNTKDLNVIDTVALNLYCNFSKVFNSNDREKCFVQNAVDMSGINKTLQSQRQEIEDLKSRPATKEVGTIVKYLNVGKNLFYPQNSQNADSSTNNSNVISNSDKIVSYSNIPNSFNINTKNLNYVNSTSSVAVGYFNTNLSAYSFIYGSKNTTTINANNSIIIGSNIINDIASSTQIGVNNNTKLFIGADGFVGISSTSSARTQRIGNEQLLVGGRVRATGFDVDAAADMAENFPADEENIQPGNLVQFSNINHSWSADTSSTTNNFEMNGVVKAQVAKQVIGVIATNPGVVLGKNTGGVPVAFSGRVPVKVSSENGNIQKGDRITLSSREAGIGAKLLNAGQSVGIALSNDTGSGMVLMLVKNEYVYDPTVLLENYSDLKSQTNTNINSNLNSNVNQINLNSDKKICIEDTCLDKNLLQKMITFLNTIAG